MSVVQTFLFVDFGDCARAEPSWEVNHLIRTSCSGSDERRAAAGRSRAVDQREAHQLRYGEHLQADVLEEESTLGQLGRLRWARSPSEAFSTSPHLDALFP